LKMPVMIAYVTRLDCFAPIEMTARRKNKERAKVDAGWSSHPIKRKRRWVKNDRASVECK